VTLFGVPIDDHFWPSIYPGLFIGIIYGLYARGVVNVFSGVIGGMIGAIAAFIVVAKSGIEEGLLPLAFLIGVSLLGAAFLVYVVGLLTGSGRPGSAKT